MSADRRRPSPMLINVGPVRRLRRTVWRNVPVPVELLQGLHLITHDRDKPLFPYSRTTVWRRIKAIMERAGIHGSQACPKSLRHYFGVHADQNNIPQPVLQRWMGHARLESTAIYRHAAGPEEYALAQRLSWLPTASAGTAGNRPDHSPLATGERP